MKRFVIKTTYIEEGCPYRGKTYLLIKGQYVRNIGDPIWEDETYDERTAKRLCTKLANSNELDMLFEKNHTDREGNSRIYWQASFEPYAVEI